MSRIISSTQNQLIKNILLLQEKPGARKDQNLIVIEGLREVRLAVSSGFEVTSLFYCPEILGAEEMQKIMTVTVPERIEVSVDSFDRIAYRKGNGGLIALARPRRTAFSDLKPGSLPLLLVVESVEKPGNLGALLRTADAANLDGVIICDPKTDIYNPNAIRSSVGCIFTVPVVTASTEETITFLRSEKIRMFAAALPAKHFYHEADFRQPAAVIMGTEANGLSKTWLEEADELVKIPMLGKIDSMNVSASAAVLIFEAMRQRGFH